MSEIRLNDVLWIAGGRSLRAFGLPRWGLTRAQRTAPSYTRTGTAAVRGRDSLRYASADRLRVAWIGGEPYIRFEPPRSNLMTYTEDLTNAAWAKNGLAGTPVVANAGVGPTGASILDRIVEDTGAGEHYITQDATITANATIAAGGWFIAESRSWVRLVAFQPATVNAFGRYFNLATGALGASAYQFGTGSLVYARVEDWTWVTPGLYRCEIVGSIGNSATTARLQVSLASADNTVSYTGDGSSLLAGCFQLENSARELSSYIPRLDATAASRGAETFSDPFPCTPAQIADMGGATFYADFIEGLAPDWTVEGGVSTRIIQTGAANDSGPRSLLDRPSSGDNYRFYHENGTSVQGSVDLNPQRSDRIQLAGQILPTGAVRLLGRKNGAVDADSGASAALTPATAWSGALIHAGGVGTVGRGMQDFRDLAAFRGLRSIDECEAALNLFASFAA